MPIERLQQDGSEVYRLENRDLAVSICPELGANIFRLRDKKVGADLLHSPQNLQALAGEPVMWGIPILFPPNRIRDGSFDFEGRRYSFPRNTPDGHHIHGFLLHRAWRFESLSDDGDELTLTVACDLFDNADDATGFPHHLIFSYEVSLFERRVRTSLQIENKGEEAAPLGVGFHTWFSLFGSLQEWKLHMPYSAIWNLDESVMPTGEQEDRDTEGLRTSGAPLGAITFDTLFSLGKHAFVATLEHESGYSLIYSASRPFKHAVVHSARDFPHVIAIEPYTWVTDAPHLHLPSGVTGMSALRPKETRSFSTVIEVTRS